MTNETAGAGISLSGYLPGSEYSGMERVALQLWKAFEEARRSGDTTHDTLRAVVVGVVDVKNAKVPAPGSDDEPVVNVKFARIEPVTEEAEVELVLDLLLELAGRRKGDAPSLFTASPTDPDRADGVIPASGGEATSKPAKKGRGGLRALKDAHEDAVAAGDTEAAEALEREQADLEQAEDARAAGVGDPFTVS